MRNQSANTIGNDPDENYFRPHDSHADISDIVLNSTPGESAHFERTEHEIN